MNLVFRISAAGVVIALATAAILGFLWSPINENEEPNFRRDAQIGYAPLPAVNTGSGASLIERSPFVRDRSAFDRDALAARETAPIDIRLTGIVRLGGQMSASLQIDGQPLVVRTGSETPVGKIANVETSAVVFEDGRRIEIGQQ